jgi:hypothetical protein
MKGSSKFVQLLIFVSTLALLEVVNNSYANAEGKYASSDVVKPSESKVISIHNQPSSISQLVTSAYDCSVAADQQNATPPTVSYRATLTCRVGKPVSMVLNLYNSNVNFPQTLRTIGPNRHTCSLTSLSCTTPTYTRTINRTQHLWVYVGVNILGTDGVTYSDAVSDPSVRTYNDRGSGYPLIRPTRGDMAVVRFPVDPPYVERVPRGSGFLEGLRQIYIRNNWTIPPAPVDAHHIKPLAWGGSDDPQTNGVFLGRTTHQLFTTWWASFSNLNW